MGQEPFEKKQQAPQLEHPFIDWTVLHWTRIMHVRVWQLLATTRIKSSLNSELVCGERTLAALLAVRALYATFYDWNWSLDRDNGQHQPHG